MSLPSPETFAASQRWPQPGSVRNSERSRVAEMVLTSPRPHHNCCARASADDDEQRETCACCRAAGGVSERTAGQHQHATAVLLRHQTGWRLYYELRLRNQTSWMRNKKKISYMPVPAALSLPWYVFSSFVFVSSLVGFGAALRRFHARERGRAVK